MFVDLALKYQWRQLQMIHCHRLRALLLQPHCSLNNNLLFFSTNSDSAIFHSFIPHQQLRIISTRRFESIQTTSFKHPSQTRFCYLLFQNPRFLQWSDTNHHSKGSTDDRLQPHQIYFAKDSIFILQRCFSPRHCCRHHWPNPNGMLNLMSWRVGVVLKMQFLMHLGSNPTLCYGLQTNSMQWWDFGSMSLGGILCCS